MERIFQILAVTLAFPAAYFFINDNSDWAFAFAVFAISSAFLAYRFRLKERLKAAVETADD